MMSFGLRIRARALVGKNVWVRTIKNQDETINFIVEDKYKGNLPLTTEYYTNKIEKVTKIYQNLKDNTIINCKVISINSNEGYFNLKWIIVNTATELWIDEEINDLIGKIVSVKVIKKGTSFDYLINDEYNAILVISEDIYSYSKKAVTKLRKELVDGEIIQCEVLSVDKEIGYFNIKWVFISEDGIDWSSMEVYNLVGKTLLVNAVKRGEGNFEFIINDKYKAIMPITPEIYKTEFEITKKNYEELIDNTLINCSVLSVNLKEGYFTIKWVKTKEINSIWYNQEVDNLIGKVVQGKVVRVKNNISILINHKYPAILPITPEIYQNNRKGISAYAKSLKNGAAIKCEIISVNRDIGHFVVKLILHLENDIDWLSNELQSMYGHSVWVRVHKKGEKEYDFLVQDEYKGKLPIKTKYYPDNIEVIKNNFKKLEDNTIIHCRIIAVDIKEGCFTLKWEVPKEKGVSWYSREVDELIHKTIQVQLKKSNKGTNFLINKKYTAILPITEDIYPTFDLNAIKSSLNAIVDGSHLKCYIISVNKEEGYFILRWIFQNKNIIYHHT